MLLLLFSFCFVSCSSFFRTDFSTTTRFNMPGFMTHLFSLFIQFHLNGGGGGSRTRVQNKSKSSRLQVQSIYYHKLTKIDRISNHRLLSCCDPLFREPFKRFLYISTAYCQFAQIGQKALSGLPIRPLVRLLRSVCCYLQLLFLNC